MNGVLRSIQEYFGDTPVSNVTVGENSAVPGGSPLPSPCCCQTFPHTAGQAASMNGT